jgi:hypothetical protein
MRYGALVGLIATLAVAGGQTVSFPIGYYSYEDIAQRMSVGGRRVVCSPDLNNAIVLLHLKPRDWNQTRRILENTLEIQFRPAGEGDDQWVLARPSELRKQDARLIEALARTLNAELRTQRTVLQKIAQSRVPIEQITMDSASRLFGKTFSRDPELARYEYQRLMETVALLRGAPFPELFANWRNLQQFQKAFAEGIPREPICVLQVDPSSPITQQRKPYERPPIDWQRVIERFLENYSRRDFGIHPSLLRLAEQHARLPQSEWSTRYGKHWFDDPSHRMVWALRNQCGKLLKILQEHVHATIAQRLHPPLNLQNALEQGALAQVYTLEVDTESLALWLGDAEGVLFPPDAPATTRIELLATVQWYESMIGYGVRCRYILLHPKPPRERRIFFDESAHLAFSHDTLSRLFEKAAPPLQQRLQQALRQHHSLLEEPVLRQFPPRAGDRSHSIYERLHEWAQLQNQEIAVEKAMTWDAPTGWCMALRLYVKESTPIHEALRKHTQYAEALLDRYETVWTLRNFVAFLSRLQRVPVAPIRRLVLSDGAAADWNLFYQSLTPLQAARLVNRSGYIPEWLRDGKTLLIDADSASDYGKAWLIWHILEQLPASERERLLQEPRWADVIPIPLGRLPASAKARLAEVFRLWALTSLAAEGFYIADRRDQVWFDMLTGRLPMDEFLDAVVLERRHGGWELRFNVSDPSLPGGVLFFISGLPRAGGVVWKPIF